MSSSVVKHPAGMIHSSEDGYVCAQLQKQKNRWVVHRVRRYPGGSSVKQLPLLKSWMFLGLSTRWQACGHVDEETWTAAETAENGFTPTVLSVELGMHLSRLQFNLAGITTDDLFLATIPLEYEKVTESSFLSVYKSADGYLVGVTIEKRLCAVFRFIPDSVPVQSHIGRVQRFWSAKTGTDFPQTVCYIGFDNDMASEDEGIVVPVDRWGEGEDDLRACGLALAHTIGDRVPLIHGQTISAGMLRMRNRAALSAAALILLACISLLIPYGLASHYEKRVTHYKNEYQKILKNNREIRDRFDYNKKIAGRIQTLQTLFTRQTAWSRLLSVLSTAGPDGLYLDKLGSQDSKTTPATLLAFSGWAPSESVVTRFISTLTNEPYISDVQLSSIQRDSKRKSITRFKIQCLLHEIKQ
ncbi:MAG: PilN domain-containing protein [Chitinivibrionales bacterium]